MQFAHPEFILPGQQLVIPEQSEVGDEWPMAGRTAGRAAASPAFLSGQPAQGWSYAPRRRGVAVPSPPVVRYDRVYVGLGDGVYYCIDKSSGRARWRMPAPLVSPSESVALAAPAVFDGLVYLGTPAGLVLALDAFRGTLIWKVEAGGAGIGAPAVVGDVVYAGTRDGHVVALEAKTGALVWRHTAPAPIEAQVAAGPEAVYALDVAGTLWALDSQTGEVRWSRLVGADLAAWPVVTELLVLAGGMALDPQNGQVQWQVDEQTPPACGGEVVFYPGGAVNLFSGEYCWHAPDEPTMESPAETAAAPAAAGVPAPAPVGGLVAAGPLLLAACADGSLRAWHSAGGGAAWELDLGAAPCHAPAVVPGQVLVSLADGSLRTVRARHERSPANR